MIRQPLKREQVIGAIERNGDGAIPLLLHKMWGQGLWESCGTELSLFERDIPNDICDIWCQMPGSDFSPNENPRYRFGYKDYRSAERHSIGQSAVLLPDWDELDQFLEDFPDPREAGNFDAVAKQAKEARNGRYMLGCWWCLFHERFWSIRGMENLMMDYYDDMDNLKRLGARMIEFYKVLVDRYRDLGCDGIFSSDDLGHQKGPMMSPAIFRELYTPLYQELIEHVHSRGMHMFLHSCGDNSLLMDDLIEAGLDVFHPVQKNSMDMEQTAKKYRGRICFHAGVDVQQMLPNSTPEEVRREVRWMKETFQTSGGGLILGMGNGVMPDSPIENIKAALHEMCVSTV